MMLISDTSGVGKSTVLAHVSEDIIQNSPTNWVVRIDLNDHTDTLNALQGEEMSEKKATEFVLEEMLKLKPPLELD